MHVVIAFTLLAAASQPHISAAGRDVKKTVIADGIYQFTALRDAYVRELNSVAIVTADDVLVFDTDTRPSTARIVLAEIRKITPKPVRYIVNSHWHPDHWSGNQVYAEAFPGLDIIATERVRDTMMNVAPAWPARFAGALANARKTLEQEIANGKLDDGTPLTPELRKDEEDDVRDFASFVDEQSTLRRTYPTLTYADHLTIQHGGREFRFLDVTGDAEGTTVLYLPKEKVLMTGAAVSYPIPYITPPPTRHAKSLRMLAQLDVDVIIPGHGPAFHDKNFINLEASLLESVAAGVHKALLAGMTTLDQVQKAVTVDELRDQFAHGDPDLENRYRERVKSIVKMAIRAERDGQDYQ